MRIVAGQLGGRMFDSPHTQATHPMSERARGALFNILGELDGLRVLDAFAGSGALAFEAVSRGAAEATLLEVDKRAQQTIDRNIALLDIGNHVHLIKSSADAWLRTAPPSVTFDIILCDPPYDNLQPKLIQHLATRSRPGGMLVLSCPKGLKPLEINLMEPIEQRSYSDLQLVFYRQIA